MSQFVGYVIGWTAPTYIPVESFLRASTHTGGYDSSVVYHYHASAFASAVDSIVYDRRKARVFVRRIRKDKNGVLFSLVLEKKHPDSLETYPDVTFRIPINPTEPAEIVSVDHRFPMNRSELQSILDKTRQEICSASVLAKLTRYITRYGAVSLRKGGGAYFIPGVYENLVGVVERTLEDLGGETMKFAVTGQEYELKTVFESLREQFQSMVDQLRLRAEKAKREKTHDKLLHEMTEIINITSVYKDILGAYAQDIGEVFNTAKRTLIQTLSIPSKSQEQPTSAPSPNASCDHNQYELEITSPTAEPPTIEHGRKNNKTAPTQQLTLLM